MNDSDPLPASKTSRASPARRSELVFWSPTDHRWKPVPIGQCSGSALGAAEVSYWGPTGFPGFVREPGFSQQEIDAAIDARAASHRHNVDPSLVRALIKVESNLIPTRVSRKGAMGLMQLMPQTARRLQLTNPFDPKQT